MIHVLAQFIWSYISLEVFYGDRMWRLWSSSCSEFKTVYLKRSWDEPGCAYGSNSWMKRLWFELCLGWDFGYGMWWCGNIAKKHHALMEEGRAMYTFILHSLKTDHLVWVVVIFGTRTQDMRVQKFGAWTYMLERTTSGSDLISSVCHIIWRYLIVR